MELRRRISLGYTRLRPLVPILALGGLLALVPYPTCILRLFFGVPCPACGLTRATLAAARLDLHEAVHYHPLSPALLALLGLSAALAFFLSDQAWSRFVKIATGVAGVALLIVWALRFAGLFGGPVS